MSQAQSLSGCGGVSLLHELLTVLRRALGQQAAVREALYTGLQEVRWGAL
jgi:FANCI helical domain 2